MIRPCWIRETARLRRGRDETVVEAFPGAVGLGLTTATSVFLGAATVLSAVSSTGAPVLARM